MNKKRHERLLAFFMSFVLGFSVLGSIGGIGTVQATDKPTITATIKNGEEVALLEGGIYDFASTYTLDKKGTSPQYLEVQGADEYAPKSLTLSWSGVDDAESCIVKIGKKANLSDAKQYTAGLNSVVIYDLEAATHYYYQIVAQYAGETIESQVFDFETSALPRTVYIDGVSNTRDIGGYYTEDGMYQIGQGLVWRGANIANISAAGKEKLLDELGIRTILALNGAEGGAVDKNKLQTEDLNYVAVSAPSYVYDGYEPGITSAAYREALVTELRVFADKSNYPIYFHCAVGRDRTGTLATLINALCGVGKEDLYLDYELSFFAASAWEDADGSNRAEALVNYEYTDLIEFLERQEGATLAKKTENFMLDIGITAQEIANIRSIMRGTDDVVSGNLLRNGDFEDAENTAWVDATDKPIGVQEQIDKEIVTVAYEADYENPSTDAASSATWWNNPDATGIAGNGTITNDPDGSNNRCVVSENYTGTLIYMANGVELQAGQEYTISFRAKDSGIVWDAYTTHTAETVKLGAMSGISSWKEYKITFEATSETMNLVIWHQAGQLYIDDVKIYSVEKVPNTEVMCQETHENYNAGTAISTYWRAEAGTNAVVVADPSDSNNKCVKTVNETISYTGIKNLDTTGTVEYTVHFRLKSDGTVGGWDAYTNTGIHIQDPAALTTEWQDYSINFTTTSEKVTLTFWHGAGDLYIDDIKVTCQGTGFEQIYTEGIGMELSNKVLVMKEMNIAKQAVNLIDGATYIYSFKARKASDASDTLQVQMKLGDTTRDITSEIGTQWSSFTGIISNATGDGGFQLLRTGNGEVLFDDVTLTLLVQNGNFEDAENTAWVDETDKPIGAQEQIDKEIVTVAYEADYENPSTDAASSATWWNNPDATGTAGNGTIINDPDGSDNRCVVSESYTGTLIYMANGVELQAGQEYTISFRAKDSGIVWDAYTTHTAETVKLGAMSGVSSWKEYKITFEATSETMNLVIWHQAGQLYIDDVKIYSVEKVPNTEVACQETHENYNAGTAISTYWRAEAGTNAVVVADPTDSNNKCVKTVNETISYTGIKNLDTTGTVEYTVHFRLKSDGTVGGWDAYTNTGIHIQDPVALTTEWQDYSINFTTTSEKVTLTFWHGAGDLYIDDIKVTCQGTGFEQTYTEGIGDCIGMENSKILSMKTNSVAKQAIPLEDGVEYEYAFDVKGVDVGDEFTFGIKAGSISQDLTGKVTNGWTTVTGSFMAGADTDNFGFTRTGTGEVRIDNVMIAVSNDTPNPSETIFVNMGSGENYVFTNTTGKRGLMVVTGPSEVVYSNDNTGTGAEQSYATKVLGDYSVSITTESGTFSYTVALYKRGNAHDGLVAGETDVIDARDLIAMKKFIADRSIAGVAAYKAADVNEDGVVDANDAVFLRDKFVNSVNITTEL